MQRSRFIISEIRISALTKKFKSTFVSRALFPYKAEGSFDWRAFSPYNFEGAFSQRALFLKKLEGSFDSRALLSQNFQCTYSLKAIAVRDANFENFRIAGSHHQEFPKQISSAKLLENTKRREKMRLYLVRSLKTLKIAIKLSSFWKFQKIFYLYRKFSKKTFGNLSKC